MTDLIAVQKIAGWEKLKTEKLKTLVLDSVSSPITKRVYNMALDEFLGWFQQAPRPGFTKATVSAWRVSLEDERGNIVKWYGTMTDIEDRKRAEEALRKANADLAHITRVMTMGELAASIAHEINQPLTAVVTNADACMEWLSSEPPNLEEARAAVDCIAQDGTRASEVIRHIRAMFTKANPERTRVHINEVIRDIGGLMQAEASRNQVALQTELAADLPATIGDRVQLQQVIVNLVLNGIEAMSAVTDRPRRLVIRSERQDSDQVLIAVRDSGVGIDAKDFRQIFDAFFTTKAQGMGMGLSICHSIIEAHGGRLWATTNSDHGATLQFTLPADRETAS
jgi:C4-dicarboxylate-specific signal transduction histidine kinase